MALSGFKMGGSVCFGLDLCPECQEWQKVRPLGGRSRAVAGMRHRRRHGLRVQARQLAVRRLIRIALRDAVIAALMIWPILLA